MDFIRSFRPDGSTTKKEQDNEVYCINYQFLLEMLKDSFIKKDSPVICYYDLTSYPYILADWILKTLRRIKKEE